MYNHTNAKVGQAFLFLKCNFWFVTISHFISSVVHVICILWTVNVVITRFAPRIILRKFSLVMQKSKNGSEEKISAFGSCNDWQKIMNAASLKDANLTLCNVHQKYSKLHSGARIRIAAGNCPKYSASNQFQLGPATLSKLPKILSIK